jgi:hypothetical protein
VASWDDVRRIALALPETDERRRTSIPRASKRSGGCGVELELDRRMTSVRNSSGMLDNQTALEALERLDPAEAARWRSVLRETARPCGCQSGAALSMLMLVGWPLAAVLSGLPGTPLGVGLAVVLYACVVVAAGVVGKVVGIVVGRLRHRALRRRLRRRVADLRSEAGVGAGSSVGAGLKAGAGAAG